jgi:hypothetical protein
MERNPRRRCLLLSLACRLSSGMLSVMQDCKLDLFALKNKGMIIVWRNWQSVDYFWRWRAIQTAVEWSVHQFKIVQRSFPSDAIGKPSIL